MSHSQVALQKILNLFETGNVPEAISIATFPKFDVPSNKWSLANRVIMVINGTMDARGYRQWEEVGRHVKKGCRAFHILAPWIAKKTDPETQEERSFVRGFLSVPVFAVEDTEGDELDYKIPPLPQLPLMDICELWGIKVKASNYFDFLGAFSPQEKIIFLATPEEKTFFHELSHVAHSHIKGGLKPGQDWRQEIAAELCAQTLCFIYGKNPGVAIGNSYKYIKAYAQEAGKDVGSACVSVLGDVEKILNLIMDTSKTIAEKQAHLAVIEF